MVERTHVETLREAAAEIRKSIPDIAYDPTPDPGALAGIAQVKYKGRWRGYGALHRRIWRSITWCTWRRNDYWPWHTGYPENRWMRPLHYAHHVWFTVWAELRTDSDAPESALDGGNVLIYWSECAPFISTWTVPVAEAIADWLDSTANTWEGFAQRDPAALKLAEQILSAVTR